MIEAVVVVVFGCVAYGLGRLHQVLRDQRAHTEAYRALRSIVRVNPGKALEVLDTVLGKEKSDVPV